MVTKLKDVDVVVIGMGWTGSILSRELTKAGLQVVGLERGNGAAGAPAGEWAGGALVTRGAGRDLRAGVGVCDVRTEIDSQLLI